MENEVKDDMPSRGFSFNTINHWMIKPDIQTDTPEGLYEAAKQYFMWCESNPIYKDEIIKQTGAIQKVCLPRIFNLPAVCIHCGVDESYIMDMAHNKAAGMYHEVAKWILRCIYSQNLEYSVVGIFSPTMVSKKLNLGVTDESGNAPTTVIVNVVKQDSTPELENNEKEES